jgi:hypothetical protein
MELKLEIRDSENRTGVVTGYDQQGKPIITMLVAPAVTEDYWTYRVQLGQGQAIVGFPKFGTIGIGFAKEKDWNTNLPYTCEDEKIYGHIKHNAGHCRATRSEILAAIQMVQDAARRDREQGSHKD